MIMCNDYVVTGSRGQGTRIKGWFSIKKTAMSFQKSLGIVSLRDRSGPPLRDECYYFPVFNQNREASQVILIILPETPQPSTFASWSPSAPAPTALTGSAQLRAIFRYSKTSKTNRGAGRGRGRRWLRKKPTITALFMTIRIYRRWEGSRSQQKPDLSEDSHDVEKINTT